jgi:hypothetical protein
MFCWDIPLHRPYVGLIYGRYLQFRIPKFPLGWWVVWNMNFMTFHIVGLVIPTDEFIFFRGIETTNQVVTSVGHNFGHRLLFFLLFSFIFKAFKAQTGACLTFETSDGNETNSMELPGY